MKMQRSLLSVLFILISLLVSLTSTAQNPSASSAAALTQLAKLTASDGTASQQFGTYVAISGNTAVIGYGHNEAYVFVKGANGWMDMTETAKLAGSDGQVTLGSAAISGNTVAISGYDSFKNIAGVYVFVRPSGGWTGTVTETAILGTATGVVAISGNTIVVGGGFLDSVYVKPAGGWKSTTQADATLTIPQTTSSNFTTLAVSGTTVVAGAPQNFSGEGTLYVYSRPSAGWSGNLNPTATLVASNGLQGLGLGWSVAVSGRVVVAGAVYTLQFGPGAVYVFVEPAGGWVSMSETARLTAQNTIDLGWSVGISGNATVAGAPFNTVGFNQFQGAAYVYVKPTSGWKSTSHPSAILAASDGVANDWFGLSVGISGGTVLAGAPQATVGSNALQGAAYVFGK